MILIDQSYTSHILCIWSTFSGPPTITPVIRVWAEFMSLLECCFFFSTIKKHHLDYLTVYVDAIKQ